MSNDRYGREYFERWYRAEGFGSPARLDRKVAYALGAAEYLLERPVRCSRSSRVRTISRGDVGAYRRRSRAFYSRAFVGAGLARIGPHLYVGNELAPTLASLERPMG